MVTELHDVMCRNCLRLFDPWDSDACRFANYCSRDCELDYVDHNADVEVSDDCIGDCTVCND